MAHNKSNTALLHEIDITFSPIYLSEATYVISSFNLMTVLNELIADAIIILQNYRSLWIKAIYVAFSNNAIQIPVFTKEIWRKTKYFQYLVFIRCYPNPSIFLQHLYPQTKKQIYTPKLKLYSGVSMPNKFERILHFISYFQNIKPSVIAWIWL